MNTETYTQIRVVTFATVVSIMIAVLLPFLCPIQGMDADDVDRIMGQRAELQAFTGASMVNQSPFQLTGVYTPYIPGQSAERYTKDGMLYGESINPYTLNGTNYIDKVANIKLDPEHKSSSMLIADNRTVETEYQRLKDWADGGNYDWWELGRVPLDFLNMWLHKDVLNEDPYETYTKTTNYSTWVYSGYRYVFEPSLNVDYATETGEASSDRMSLSIVWYDIESTEGISGGLVIYENKTKQLVANITAGEVVRDYDLYSGRASIYTLAFDGLPMKMAIKFDTSALDGSMELLDAWSKGYWTVGFYASSIHNFIDVENSMSYELTLGSLVDTYTQIFTLNYPTLGAGWDIIVWIMCSLPMLLVLVGAILNVIDSIHLL